MMSLDAIAAGPDQCSVEAETVTGKAPVGGKADSAFMNTGRTAAVEVGALGTSTTIVVVSVISLAFNSLMPSSEAMSVILSNVPPFLIPGVVRSSKKKYQL